MTPTLIETSLHETYQADQWGVREAIREIVSNALDEQARSAHEGRGQMEVVYSKRTRVLSITNRGSKVPASALLMGTSEAREEANAIGTFGEGLPMALLVLARCGMNVTIYNGIEKWEPILHKSAVYKERILAIKTRQLLQDRDAFIVELNGIDEQEYKAFQELFLSLDPRFDKKETVVAGYYGERILLQPCYVGRVYNKGVYVFTQPKLAFGYDLNTRLNRDRHMVSDSDLESHVGTLLKNASSRGDERIDLLIAEKFLDASDLYEPNCAYLSLRFSDSAQKALSLAFLAKYGGTSLPVDTIEQAREAEFFGRKGVIVSPLARMMLQNDKNMNFYSLRASGLLAAKAVHQWDALNQKERLHLKTALGLVKLVVPSWTPNVRVVDFGGPTILGTYRREDSQIDLSRNILPDFTATLSTLVHEVCHAVGEDGEAAHTESQVSVLSKMIEKLLGKALA